MNLNLLRLQLLQDREARAAAIARLAGALPDGHALVFLSLNVPGPVKESPRLDAVFERARETLPAADARPRRAAADARPRRAAADARPRRAAADARPRRAATTGVADEGRDALGPWLGVAWPGKPDDIKRECIAIEERLPAGRLVDLDVYDRLGRQVDRGSLGQSPRRCLVCREAAVDCMRAGRHRADEIAVAVDRLLHVNDVARLADALVDAARIELDLTPKPGLVDRRDNGSHPDLSFDLMERSIALLPEYYAELLSLAGLKPCSTVSLPNPAEAGFHGDRLAACIAAGRQAEERMLAAIGTNAHRGYIFLSGLVLLAFAESDQPGPAATLSPAIADLARRLVALRANRATVVAQDGLPGVGAEGGLTRAAHGGMPAVAERGLTRAAHGGMPGVAERGLTDAAHGGMPGVAECGLTDAAHGGMPGVAEGSVTGVAEGSVPAVAERSVTGVAEGSVPAVAEGSVTGVAQGSSPARSSHGETARLRHGVGGIFGEALAGLPSVFEHALPALERAEARYGATDAARHAAMATLMTVVEDTTTLHRCGAKALQRLRDDGRRILEAIESGDGYVPLLEMLNEEYRAAGMTMGGVADCLAITIAIRALARHGAEAPCYEQTVRTATPQTPARTSPRPTPCCPRRS